MENIPPFYVGQRVIKLIQGNTIKKGQVVSVISCSLCPKCNEWVCEVDVFDTVIGRIPCLCGFWLPATSKWIAVNAKNLAPIEENFQSISLSKVLEEETKLISVN